MERQESGHSSAVIVSRDLGRLSQPQLLRRKEVMTYSTDPGVEVLEDDFPHPEGRLVRPASIVVCQRHCERRLVPCKEVALVKVVVPDIEI